ncbi:hypothetical protein [Desulfolithobacter sp.]
MKYFLLAGCIVLATLIPANADQDAPVPHEIGGFSLGSSVEDYDFISYRNFLNQVVVENIPGFRKGIIYYGVCERPGEIVKIKLKYRDSSERFFQKLMKEYKSRFGEPDEYVGDAFGVVKAWKWAFTDRQGNRVSLVLQHNLQNPDESTGNTVKLSLPDRIRTEERCFRKLTHARAREQTDKKAREQLSPEDWIKMIPR